MTPTQAIITGAVCLAIWIAAAWGQRGELMSRVREDLKRKMVR